MRDLKEGTGILSAWDPVTQKERWFAEGGGNRFGGAVSTASNLVFQVTPQGRLRAYTADKGERLLDIPTGETVGLGPPITYMHNGKQYVALMGGQGQPSADRTDCPLVARACSAASLAVPHPRRRRNPVSPHHSAACPLFHLRQSRTGACEPEAVRVRAALTANAAQIIFGSSAFLLQRLQARDITGEWQGTLGEFIVS